MFTQIQIPFLNQISNEFQIPVHLKIKALNYNNRTASKQASKHPNSSELKIPLSYYSIVKPTSRDYHFLNFNARAQQQQLLTQFSRPTYTHTPRNVFARETTQINLATNWCIIQTAVVHPKSLKAASIPTRKKKKIPTPDDIAAKKLVGVYMCI